MIDFAAVCARLPTASVPTCMVDMAHFAGSGRGRRASVALPHAHVATTTTHKTLRGPRGGMILTNDERHREKGQLGRSSPAFRAAR